MKRVKPLIKQPVDYPIKVEVHKQPINKLYLGIFLGFWIGYAPYIIHQMQWLR